MNSLANTISQFLISKLEQHFSHHIFPVLLYPLFDECLHRQKLLPVYPLLQHKSRCHCASSVSFIFRLKKISCARSNASTYLHLRLHKNPHFTTCLLFGFLNSINQLLIFFLQRRNLFSFAREKFSLLIFLLYQLS